MKAAQNSAPSACEKVPRYGPAGSGDPGVLGSCPEENVADHRVEVGEVVKLPGKGPLDLSPATDGKVLPSGPSGSGDLDLFKVARLGPDGSPADDLHHDDDHHDLPRLTCDDEDEKGHSLRTRRGQKFQCGKETKSERVKGAKRKGRRMATRTGHALQ